MKHLFGEFEEQFFVEQKIREIIPNVKTIGNTLRFSCPVCGDGKKRKTRGNYYKQTNSYNCFNEGCTASGLFIISMFEKRDIKDVRKEFLTSLDLLKGGKNEENFKKNKKTCKNSFSSNAKTETKNAEIETKEKIKIEDYWLELTGKNLETIKKRGVLNAINSPKNWKLFFDKTSKRIIIPWYKHHKIEYYQSRATLKTQELKYCYPKDIEKPIFNVDNITSKYNYIFCTEGAFDAVFIENGIALGTTSFTKHQTELLTYQFPFHKTIIILDNQNVDKAAHKKLLKEAKKNKNQLYFIWPKHIKDKDINEYMINHNFNNIFTPEFIIKNSYKNDMILAKLIL